MRLLGAATIALSALFVGCHAKPDDPAGQAEELSDPVRRENAIANLQNLYTSRLAAADGDRSVETVQNDEGRDVPGPMGVANASVGALTQTYLDHPEDAQNGERILNLLLEMQDPRAMPAFLKALDWRAEVSETHAITAAQAIERMTLPDDQVEPAITAISSALERVQGSRGVDNRMRIHFIRTLGHLGDRRATPILTSVAMRIHEDQSFLINIMAAEELGKLRDPAAVPTMIKALFLFAHNRPDQRMNDVGAQGLVQIGRPSLEPLTQLLAGENEEANRIANNYVTAVRNANAEAGANMDPRTVVVGEACYALGQLGFRESIDPLLGQVTPLTGMATADIGETQRPEISRALSCVTSLVQINREDSDTPRLRQALMDTYSHIPEEWPPEAPYTSRAQVLAAMQHTYDVGLLDFLHGIAANREELFDFRVVAFIAHVMIANRDEVGRDRAVIEAEPEGSEVRQRLEEFLPAIETAQECNDDLQCYIGKLGDSNPMVVRKAAYMIARYGRGNAAALTALIEHIDHNNVPVRGDVLYAIDWVATEGSPEAVAEIERVRGVEEGRSSWNQIKELAMAVRARLSTRGG
ncbi:MAG: HEAT repeat domain-containing protein [Sandaracinaceae bacterium]